jgi:aryl-alcohol dehydrogenase-like predicted oxidoreductase
MQYNPLLPQSPPVSEIGLGAWQLGVNSGWKSLSEAEAIGLVKQSLELGVNFFDTAPNYGLGTGESRLGKALKGVDRSKIVISTKFGHTDTGELNYDASYLRTSLESSLRRLQTDYVDSLLLHNPPFEYLDGNQTDHYEILEKLKDEGKIRAYGASLDTPEEMRRLMETTNAQVIEAFFNILHQKTAEAFEMAKEQNVGIIAKIPLDSGWLGGKYDADSAFTDIRKRWSKADIQTRAQLVDRVRQILGKERQLASSAIAFCLAFDAIATVIPGNTSIAQLKSNVASAEAPLPKQLVDALKLFYKQDVEGLNLPW